MAGLGIQQSMNNLIETGTNSVTAHELFMSRFKEFYDEQNTYNQKVAQHNKENPDEPQLQQVQAPRVRSIKDRLNASANIQERTEVMKKANQLFNKMDADAAKQRAEEARKQKLKEKAQARAKRPKPSTPDEVMKGVLNFHGNE